MSLNIHLFVNKQLTGMKKIIIFSDPDIEFLAEEGFENSNNFTLIRNGEDRSSKSYEFPYQWLDEQNLEIPAELDVYFIEGESPSHDWVGVSVIGYDTLIKFQELLYAQNLKVNFIVKVEI